MIDFQILKCCLSDKSWYHKYGALYTYSDPLLYNISEQIRLLYNHSNITTINQQDIINILINLYKDIKYKDIINTIYNVVIDDEYINNILIPTLYNRNIIEALQKEINTKIETDDYTNIDELLLRVEEAKEEQIEAEELTSTLSLEEYTKEHIGYSWPLDFLNKELGPLPPSTFGLVAAQVEVGKTAFIIDSSVHFLTQNAKVLHLNNEDPIHKLLERYYIRAFDKPKTEIYRNLHGYSSTFNERYRNRLNIIDTAEISLFQLEKIIKAYLPDVVFIDQIDPMSNAISPDVLEVLYKNIRKLAKKYETRVIGVTQASDSEEGGYMELRDLHNSKVGKQAALDWMLGLGSGAIARPEERYLSLPKNKLTGSHAKTVVILDAPAVRFRG